MTDLLERFDQDVQLHGFAQRPCKMYVRAVRQLADHCKKSPDSISEEDLRDYFLYMKNLKGYSHAASTVALCVIKFFYENTIKRERTTLKLARPPRQRKLPAILSKEDVRKLLANVRIFRHRICLSTICS